MSSLASEIDRIERRFGVRLLVLKEGESPEDMCICGFTRRRHLRGTGRRDIVGTPQCFVFRLCERAA